MPTQWAKSRFAQRPLRLAVDALVCETYEISLPLSRCIPTSANNYAAGQFAEWRVVLHGQGSAFAGRLCAVRKSDCAIQQAHRRLQRRASKKQMITRPGTLELTKYVIVFTTCSSGSTADVLRSYRMRWQIELVFKRLKSLAQLGHVPKHDDRSSRAWLYGKLLVTLLAQQLIRIGRDISPSGYPLSPRRTM